MTVTLDYEPQGTTRFRCTLLAPKGAHLYMEGSLKSVRPRVAGSRRLARNTALVESMFAYAKHEFQYRRLRSPEVRRSHDKAAQHYHSLVIAVTDMALNLGNEHRSGWCSCCFSFTVAKRVNLPHQIPPAYLCTSCGSPVSVCAAPRCNNLASRTVRKANVPHYCAEHRHEIPGFDKANNQLERIDLYKDWMTYDKRNLSKTTKITVLATVTAIAVVPAALGAAPAIGGALGSSALGGSLSGAAATSHGLAMIGGGSLAAGGLGMAGGTAIIAAIGAGLGGVMGCATASAYASADKSFAIKRLKRGTGTPVLITSGFLTENDDGWGQWARLVQERYPEAPVYRVFWGSKELRSFALLLGLGASKWVIAREMATAAARATAKGAKKVPYLAEAAIVQGAITNPWHVAVSRADMTGAILADLVERTDEEKFVLIGHSLGARVMYTAAKLLGTQSGPPRLESVHLLGAAVSTGDDLRTVHNSVSETVWNYHSRSDRVLQILYKNAQFRRSAAGAVGFQSKFTNIHDRNVTRLVPRHSDYFERIHLTG